MKRIIVVWLAMTLMGRVTGAVNPLLGFCNQKVVFNDIDELRKAVSE